MPVASPVDEDRPTILYYEVHWTTSRSYRHHYVGLATNKDGIIIQADPLIRWTLDEPTSVETFTQWLIQQNNGSIELLPF